VTSYIIFEGTASGWTEIGRQESHSPSRAVLAYIGGTEAEKDGNVFAACPEGNFEEVTITVETETRVRAHTKAKAAVKAKATPKKKRTARRKAEDAIAAAGGAT
jgi:hypothetical protein